MNAEFEQDFSTWPRSSRPVLARMDMHEIRVHPWWQTPVRDACPSVAFASVSPELKGGDMFRRVTQRLSEIDAPRYGISPTEIMLLRDNLDLPGLRLVAASQTRGSCMMGWSHTHCLVGSQDAYCPDGTADELQRLVRDRRLRPTDLSDVAWLELAVVMMGVETIVLEPELIAECTRVQAAEAFGPEVAVSSEEVVVRFAAIEQGNGVAWTVRIDDSGEVTVGEQSLWALPPDPHAI